MYLLELAVMPAKGIFVDLVASILLNLKKAYKDCLAHPATVVAVTDETQSNAI